MDARTRPQVLAKPRRRGFAQAPTAIIFFLIIRPDRTDPARDVQISTFLRGYQHIESFGRQLNVRSVTANALTLRGIAQVDSVRPLRFIDLAGGLARLGADNRLMGGDYDVTQAWAKALWEHPEQADGLHYALRHDPTRRGYAVFDRAEDALHARPLGTFWDPRRRDELAGILDTYGFGLIVE